jgi:hypothetical protein
LEDVGKINHKNLHNKILFIVFLDKKKHYRTSNPAWVTFQEHGSSFYVNIEEKV